MLRKIFMSKHHNNLFCQLFTTKTFVEYVNSMSTLCDDISQRESRNDMIWFSDLQNFCDVMACLILNLGIDFNLI